jgi:hypothetical protein
MDGWVKRQVGQIARHFMVERSQNGQRNRLLYRFASFQNVCRPSRVSLPMMVSRGKINEISIERSSPFGRSNFGVRWHSAA